MSSVLHDHISSRDFQLKNLVREKRHLIMSLTKVELLSTPGSQPWARLLTGAALSTPLCLSHLRCRQCPSMLGAFCRPVQGFMFGETGALGGCHRVIVTKGKACGFLECSIRKRVMTVRAPTSRSGPEGAQDPHAGQQGHGMLSAAKVPSKNTARTHY